jgi:hypothetical protein
VILVPGATPRFPSKEVAPVLVTAAAPSTAYVLAVPSNMGGVRAVGAGQLAWQAVCVVVTANISKARAEDMIGHF